MIKYKTKEAYCGLQQVFYYSWIAKWLQTVFQRPYVTVKPSTAEEPRQVP